MNKFDRVLDNRTITHFQSSMKNLDNITYKVDKAIPNIDNFITKSVAWENNISTSFESIKMTYLNMNDTMKNMAVSFSKAQRGFDAMSHTVNNTMLESQNVMIDLQNLLDEFNHNPSDILYKKTQLQAAPGER